MPIAYPATAPPGPWTPLDIPTYTMLLKLDGIKEIGANGRSNIGKLICLRHLIRSRAVTKMEMTNHACATWFELP